MTADGDIEAQIDALESEREQLLAAESAGEQHANRLEDIRVELDRLWDLRRQRQALRDAGEPADWAQERDADTVENYEQ